MKCDVHPEKDAIAACVNCSKGICEDCKIQIAGKNYCKDCADQVFMEQRQRITENEKKMEYPKGFVGSLVSGVRDMTESAVKKVQELELDKEIDKYKEDFSKDPLMEIKKVKELLDIGAITEEEYQEMKYNYLQDDIVIKEFFKDPISEIKKAKELFDLEAITDDEFQILKVKYISKIRIRDPIVILKKAKELLDMNAITDEEFQEIKMKCLNKK